MDEGLARGHVLVSGRPGAGKSVLLRQWARGRDPASVVAVDGRRIRERSPAADVAELVARPPARAGPTVVVVDDVHELGEPTHVVTELVAHAPPHVRLLLASRVRSEVPSDLGGGRGVREVCGPDLALSPDEVAALVGRASGLDLSADDVARVCRRTEGWAVAVALLAVALRDRVVREGGEHGGVGLPDFDGTMRELAEYLAEEVVATQPRRLRRFLERTCVLDELSPDLCQALGGTVHDPGALDELARRDLLSWVPPGVEGRRRYHPLLAEMLRSELRGHDRRRHDDLLGRAARWHVERGELAVAIELLLRAERWEQALDLVSQGPWTLLERGEALSVLERSAHIPAVERARHGLAQLALAGLHRTIGNVDTAHLILEEVAEGQGADPVVRAGAEAMLATGVRWQAGPDLALAHSRRALDLLAPDVVARDEAGDAGSCRRPPTCESWIVGLACLARGIALCHLGQDDEARAWIATAERRAPSNPAWKARTLGATAALEALAGNLRAAERAGGEALALEEGPGSFDASATGLAYRGLARVAYEQGRPSDAAALLDELEWRARSCRSAVELAVLVTERARWCLARGDVAAGTELLARWRREGEAPPPADVLGRLAAVEVQLLLAAGDRSRARRTLAAAPQQDETFAVAAQLAAEAGDLALLAAVLERWETPGRTRDRIARLLWEAVADRASDRTAAARERFVAATALAEVDGHRQVFLDGGIELDTLVAEQVLAAGAAGGEVVADLGRRLRSASRRGEGAPALSARELVVLGHLVGGVTNLEVADQLGISPNTLKTHLRRIYRKLGVSDRWAARARAEAFGLIPAEGPTA